VPKSLKERKIFVIIPAYNESTVIGEVILGIKSKGYKNIIVVDDGSIDNTFIQAAKAGALTVRHQLNRGKGAATRTGIEAAKDRDADIVVTIDGDGQHDPADIKNLTEPILKNEAAVVLGTRSFNTNSMPIHKIIHNYLANLTTKVLYGYSASDSQSGFRAYSREALSVIETKSDAYEYESEVVKEINWHKLPCLEIPINTKYTTYSMTKESKQSFKSGLKTLYKMIWNVISF